VVANWRHRGEDRQEVAHRQIDNQSFVSPGDKALRTLGVMKSRGEIRTVHWRGHVAKIQATKERSS
jgi:hypothetical protein